MIDPVENGATSGVTESAGRRLLRLLPVFLLPLLVGCHADVTVRFDVHGDGTALLTTREVVDDELYKVVLSQDGSGDPLHTEQMRREGWQVSSNIDDGQNHVVTMSKLIRGIEYKQLDHATPIFGRLFQPLGTIEFSRKAGLLFDRDSVSARIVPLLPVFSSTLSRLYGGVASGLLNSVLSVHLEMKTPGKLLATNGQILPDGSARWDLNLDEPTTIEYRARVTNVYHVALAILFSSILALGISWCLSRSRRRTLVSVEP